MCYPVVKWNCVFNVFDVKFGVGGMHLHGVAPRLNCCVSVCIAVVLLFISKTCAAY